MLMEEQHLVALDDTRKWNFVLYFLFVLFSYWQSIPSTSFHND